MKKRLTLITILGKKSLNLPTTALQSIYNERLTKQKRYLLPIKNLIMCNPMGNLSNFTMDCAWCIVVTKLK